MNNRRFEALGAKLADLSTPLRFGRDDKFVVNRSSGFSSTWVGRKAHCGSDTTEFDAVLQGFELAKLYPEFREKAMEQLAQREGV
jgi:hypothetical protein